jgi:hypothetical protein
MKYSYFLTSPEFWIPGPLVGSSQTPGIWGLARTGLKATALTGSVAETGCRLMYCRLDKHQLDWYPAQVELSTQGFCLIADGSDHLLWDYSQYWMEIQSKSWDQWFESIFPEVPEDRLRSRTQMTEQPQPELNQARLNQTGPNQTVW